MTSGDLANTMIASPRPRAEGGGHRDVSDPVVYSRFPLPLRMSTVTTSNEPSENATPVGTLPISFEGPYQDTSINVIAPYVDRVFYLQTYPDITQAKIDPAVHYALFGWQEGRDPNAWFDTDYYLSTNADVKNEGINPFWHYLAAGQNEGRRPRGLANLRRNLLANIMPASARGAHDVLPPNTPNLDADTLLSLLETGLETASGMVVSISHDRYIDNVGGTQILIADEETKFVGNRFLYCHISPSVARLALAPAGECVPLQVILNGEFVGATSREAMVAAIGRLRKDQLGARIFIIHSLLGHDVDCLAAVAEALRPTDSFFWVHDFSSLCEGFNLLRNDIAFCGAPPINSMGCRICIYGSTRARHTAQIRQLFDQIPFHVIAPSSSALEIWRSGSALPHIDAQVHEHCQLSGAPLIQTDRPGILDSSPARIAFIGHRSFQKGHPFFREIVARTQGSSDYKFYHFASADSLIPTFGVTLVPTSVTRANPRAMTSALRQHDIDLVLVLSPWPETFSFVTFEAFAAGADVLAFGVGGNLPRAIRSLARGIVLSDENALYEAFTRGLIASYVQQQRAAGKRHDPLEFCGTTVTWPRPGAQSGPRRTYEPALRAAAGGQIIDPVEVGNDTYRFQLPVDCASVRILSRSVLTNWTSSPTTDTRRLGVAVTSITLDRDSVPINDPRLVGGWFPQEGQVRWTDGSATVMTSGARSLELSILPSIAYWRSDLCEVARRPALPRKPRSVARLVTSDDVSPIDAAGPSQSAPPVARAVKTASQVISSKRPKKTRNPKPKPYNGAAIKSSSSDRRTSKPRD